MADDVELTVFFDRDCPLCRRVARWLLRQPLFVPLRVQAAQSAAGRRCPLALDDLLAQVTVTASDGAVYRGVNAWLVCLWALRRWRGFALRLAAPQRRQWAARLFGLLTGLADASKRAANRVRR
jgi:predicted DCC family thiol-disulfide oxidoreductase YuxK